MGYTFTKLAMYLESQTPTDSDSYIAGLSRLLESHFAKYGSQVAEQITPLKFQTFTERGIYIADRIEHLEKKHINYPWTKGKPLLKRFEVWAKQSGILSEDLQCPGDVIFSEGPQREFVLKSMMKLAIYLNAAIWDFHTLGVGVLAPEQGRLDNIMEGLEQILRKAQTS